MTIKEYNEDFYPQFNKSLSFVKCIKHALQKCDDNAVKQMQSIGYDESTVAFIENALSEYKETVKAKCG